MTVQKVVLREFGSYQGSGAPIPQGRLGGKSFRYPRVGTPTRWNDGNAFYVWRTYFFVWIWFGISVLLSEYVKRKHDIWKTSRAVSAKRPKTFVWCHHRRENLCSQENTKRVEEKGDLEEGCQRRHQKKNIKNLIDGLTLTRTDFKAGGQNPVARLFVRHLKRGSEEKSRGGEDLNIAVTPPKVVAQQWVH